MKILAIIALLEQGKKPMVRLTGSLWDESFGCEGMLARVTGCSCEPDSTHSLSFDYSEHKVHNLGLDKPEWHLADGKKGTAVEAGIQDTDNLHENVIFERTDDAPVEIAEDNTPMSEYLASGATEPYVSWLEAKLDDLVPECMKTWIKGWE